MHALPVARVSILYCQGTMVSADTGYYVSLIETVQFIPAIS